MWCVDNNNNNNNNNNNSNNLTLDKAKTIARQKEAIAEQSAQLRDSSKQSLILLGQVSGNPSSKPQSRRRDTAVRSDKRSTVKGAARRSVGKPHCTRCGILKHQKGDRRPAKDATCNKCNNYTLSESVFLQNCCSHY